MNESHRALLLNDQKLDSDELVPVLPNMPKIHDPAALRPKYVLGGGRETVLTPQSYDDKRTIDDFFDRSFDSEQKREM